MTDIITFVGTLIAAIVAVISAILSYKSSKGRIEAEEPSFISKAAEQIVGSAGQQVEMMTGSIKRLEKQIDHLEEKGDTERRELAGLIVNLIGGVKDLYQQLGEHGITPHYKPPEIPDRIHDMLE